MAKRYFHVFGKPKDGKWYHQFSADTRADANDEVSGIRRHGDRAKIVIGVSDPLDILGRLNPVAWNELSAEQQTQASAMLAPHAAKAGQDLATYRLVRVANWRTDKAGKVTGWLCKGGA